jgi:hypothetical protein
MSFQDISFKKLAIIMIAGGIVAVFAISGFQARNVFAPSVTEEAEIIVKNSAGICVVEGSDRVPREITNCPYNEGDIISITYKPQQPAIERHELRQVASQ